MSDKKLEYNILDSELIRIDFMKIINIENRIAEIIPYLKKHGFELDEDAQDSNVEKLKDQAPLITEDIMEKTKDKGINYTFINKDEKIIINEYLLIFKKYDFKNYSSVEKYLKFLDEILDILIKEENLNYQRIGIKKTNRIIMKVGYNFNKIFKEINYNQIKDDEKNVIIENKKIVAAEDISYNIYSNIKSGIAKIINNQNNEVVEECDAYLIVLDMDYYSRNLNEYDNKKIIEKLKLLNSELDKNFKSQITEEFLDDLKNVEGNFEKYGIIEGVNKCNLN